MNTTYPAARLVAPAVREHFAAYRNRPDVEDSNLAPLPDEEIIEAIVDAAFWTSLRREEQSPPRISIAFVPPESAGACLRFERALKLSPATLTRIAPGVERPGIHLGVSHIDGELRVWGATRNLPTMCCVVETVAPGHLVIKHRRSEGAAKFINVAVLEADEVKVLRHTFPSAMGCTPILDSLLGIDFAATSASSPSNAMIRLAVSMRDHRKGGSLLIVPRDGESWRESISHPISYAVSPPYRELAELCRESPEQGQQRRWRDALSRAVDAVAGLTAIDGATIINEDYELLAFGAKIVRSDRAASLEQVAVIEPVEGAVAQMVPTGQLGGTRHISAANFAYAQRDAVALVASQDGPFTIFAWSICEGMVYAYRVDTLLL